MITEAIFENIAERIINEIKTAKKSVIVAVAWFTNKELFNSLVNKANEGCSVSLIITDDVINSNTNINFEQLNIANSRCYKVGKNGTEVMHNKFCVIDHNTVITGSYNWSYKAESNFENVIITYNDTVIAEQFISEFYRILKYYYPDDVRKETLFPIDKIIKRLEILLNYIQLEDIEEIKKASNKLSLYDFNSDLSEIIKILQKNEFAVATIKIQNFISKNKQLSSWSDPEIVALKLEIRYFENQLTALDNEKIEIEKFLSDFRYRYSVELGDIILEILRLRKLKFKFDKVKYDEAENDEKQYRKNLEDERRKQKYPLTQEEKNFIKKHFRRASFLCHPDKVSEEYKEAAHAIFIELRNAYDKNDLKKVSEILDNLEKGDFFKPKSVTISEKDKLKAMISKLRIQVGETEKIILDIKQSETYKTIISIDDWDSYFMELKENLEKELEELKQEIAV